jgi:hypothetical protein
VLLYLFLSSCKAYTRRRAKHGSSSTVSVVRTSAFALIANHVLHVLGPESLKANIGLCLYR